MSVDDEIFGGYRWFFLPDVLAARRFPWNTSFELGAALLSAGLRLRLRPSEFVSERYEEALREVPRLPGETRADARMREMFWPAITRRMVDLLERKDRMSMVTSL